MPATKSIYSGVLLLNKPTDMTSHDAVQQIRKLVNQRRVGHTGTLDPTATGLMVVCLGSATKIARFVSDMDKTYRAEIFLGMTSETYDSEGVCEDQPLTEVPALEPKELETLLEEFTGVIQQKVPAYSAVHVDGERLYKLARKGVKVETPQREVEIKKIVVNGFEPPYLKLTVTCSKGTYIRSLAHDIGQKLGCGGYLAALERTSVGHLNLDNALSFKEIEQYQQAGIFEDKLLGYHQVLDYGAFKIRDEFREYVLTGRKPGIDDILNAEGIFASGDKVLLKDTDGHVLAVGTAGISSDKIADTTSSNGVFDYIRVLN